jgi:DNA-binding XRE family transcriptional regulator
MLDPVAFREARIDRLTTIYEMAAKAGMSNKTIRKLEAGMPCRKATVRRLLAGLGISLEEAYELDLVIEV